MSCSLHVHNVQNPCNDSLRECPFSDLLLFKSTSFTVSVRNVLHVGYHTIFYTISAFLPVVYLKIFVYGVKDSSSMYIIMIGSVSVLKYLAFLKRIAERYSLYHSHLSQEKNIFWDKCLCPVYISGKVCSAIKIVTICISVVNPSENENEKYDQMRQMIFFLNIDFGWNVSRFCLTGN